MAEIEDEAGATITDEAGDDILDEGPLGFTGSYSGDVTPAGSQTRNFNGSRSTAGEF